MLDARFAGATVVVAGVGESLGAGITRAFGRAGAHVVVADNGVDEGLVEALLAEGVSASHEGLDPADPERIAALVARVVEDRGRLDVWVNNLSVRHKGPAETLAPEAWRESVDVVLSGAFYCCQAAGRQMLAQGEGVIVNVSSVEGYKAVDGGVAPCVAHAGLAMLTQALGVEWAGRGVRVVGTAPGSLAEGFSVDGRRAPLGRPGTVEEVAEAILYLASGEASYVTAETLRVDGGWTAYQLF
jgi:3-oxoacyl-[acyl-carrier protein] reductase